MDAAEKRTNYIFELMNKSERGEPLTRMEALIVVQYAFAGSIVQTLPQLEEDIERAPTEIGKQNGRLMLEAARELIDEFAMVVDEQIELADRPRVKLASSAFGGRIPNSSR